MNTTFTGVTAKQTELIAVWSEMARTEGGACPSRQRLNPGTIRKHLSHLSILDLRQGRDARFRLAGTGLRAIIGADAAGLRVSELPAPHCDIWSLGLDVVAARQAPVGGLVTEAAGERAHAWLRLPMLDRDGAPTLVLCHDALVAPDSTGGSEDIHSDILGAELILAA